MSCTVVGRWCMVNLVVLGYLGFVCMGEPFWHASQSEPLLNPTPKQLNKYVSHENSVVSSQS